jgi:hypothetical protein
MCENGLALYREMVTKLPFEFLWKNSVEYMDAN